MLVQRVEGVQVGLLEGPGQRGGARIASSQVCGALPRVTALAMTAPTARTRITPVQVQVLDRTEITEADPAARSSVVWRIPLV